MSIFVQSTSLWLESQARQLDEPCNTGKKCRDFDCVFDRLLRLLSFFSASDRNPKQRRR